MKLTELVRLPGNEAAAEVPYPWLSIPPYVDNRMAEGARRSGLPASRAELAITLTESSCPARLAAALVRVSLTRNPSPLI